MLYIEYLILASIVVFLSIKLAKYVDLIDKKTNLSGALIGGILLSAVTSLPELLTSVSATVWLKNPDLCLGNILGSNIFNLTIIGILMVFFVQSFLNANIGKSHTYTAILVTIVYVVLIVNMVGYLRFEVFTVAITSIIILICYIVSLRVMAKDTSVKQSEEEVAVDSNLTIKQIMVRFVFASIGLIIASIIITNVTNEISIELNLGAGLAGALFLGVATSLPELSSSISLFKMKNYNVAVGNIVGSSIFNFLILFIVDVVYINGSIYSFAGQDTKNLIVFGLISNLLLIFILKFKENIKNKFVVIIPAIAIVISYILSLVL